MSPTASSVTLKVGVGVVVGMSAAVSVGVGVSMIGLGVELAAGGLDGITDMGVAEEAQAVR
jgi:hypothetical protein